MLRPFFAPVALLVATLALAAHAHEASTSKLDQRVTALEAKHEPEQFPWLPMAALIFVFQQCGAPLTVFWLNHELLTYLLGFKMQDVLPCLTLSSVCNISGGFSHTIALICLAIVTAAGAITPMLSSFNSRRMLSLAISACLTIAFCGNLLTVARWALSASSSVMLSIFALLVQFTILPFLSITLSSLQTGGLPIPLPGPLKRGFEALKFATYQKVYPPGTIVSARTPRDPSTFPDNNLPNEAHVDYVLVAYTKDPDGNPRAVVAPLGSFRSFSLIDVYPADTPEKVNAG
eukprot:m.11000 g.11000  ORF g.11000 m.11000 type:complete len:290 (-) comp2583_c0_seq1:81-950(-)